MLSVRLSACFVGAALVFHGLCAAQSAPKVQTDAPRLAANQPLDLRMGAFRPTEASDALTDGGTRTAASPQAKTPPLAASGKDYRVGPNDLIDIEVLDLNNLKRTVRVNAAGAITMPLIGQVVIAGLTSQEVEERIAARYSEKYLQDPQVSVFIREFTTERISIEGAVARPGIYPLTGQITLLRALALAGGFGSIADSSQVMLFRVNDQRVREVAVYNVEKIRSGKSDDPQIKGDDLIVVQRDSTRVMLKDSLFRDIIDSVNPFSLLVPR